MQDREAIEALGWLSEALGAGEGLEDLLVPEGEGLEDLLVPEGEGLEDLLVPGGEGLAPESVSDLLSEHHAVTDSVAAANPALLLGVYAFMSGTPAEHGDDETDDASEAASLQEVGGGGGRGGGSGGGRTPRTPVTNTSGSMNGLERRRGAFVATGRQGRQDAFTRARTGEVRRRKNVTALSDEEITRLQVAIQALRDRGVYKQFVMDHAASMSVAHRQPAFLPWHRQFVLAFESELRAIDATITLPYWDWATDPGRDAAGNPTWNQKMVRLLGGDGGGAAVSHAVQSGPFAGWRVYNGAGTETTLPLQRTFGQQSALPSAADVTAALGVTPYDVAPWNYASTTGGFRNLLEGWSGTSRLHNAVHMWVGGSMLPMTSPNDPCFFLHHCFVDKIWADWQAAHPALGYEPQQRQTRPASSDALGANDDIPFWQVGGGAPVTFKPSATLDLTSLTDHRGTSGIQIAYA